MITIKRTDLNQLELQKKAHRKDRSTQAPVEKSSPKQDPQIVREKTIERIVDTGPIDNLARQVAEVRLQLAEVRLEAKSGKQITPVKTIEPVKLQVEKMRRDFEDVKRALDSVQIKLSEPKEPIVLPPPPVDPSADENAIATRELASAINTLALSKVDPPNMQEVLSAIEHVQQTQSRLIEALINLPVPETSPKNWAFSVERDNKGAIKKIHAKGE
jgi:hypothetical protein